MHAATPLLSNAYRRDMRRTTVNESGPETSAYEWMGLGKRRRVLALVGLGQVALARRAVAVAQPRLVVVERLLDAVDEHRARRRARPRAGRRPTSPRRPRAPGPEHAGAAAEAGDLGRDRADRGERLAPGQARSRRARLVSATRLPANCCRRVARLVVAGEAADRDLDPGVDHPPDVATGSQPSCSNCAGRSVSGSVITGTPAAAISRATSQPSVAPTSTSLSARELARAARAPRGCPRRARPRRRAAARRSRPGPARRHRSGSAARRRRARRRCRAAAGRSGCRRRYRRGAAARCAVIAPRSP